jgi:signal transduction histidine kinase
LSTFIGSSKQGTTGRGGLFRRFIVPQVVIAIAAGALGLTWAAYHQRKIEHDRMVGVAAANAQFMRNVSLPRSRKMADNLSIVTSSKVGFHVPDQSLIEGGDWSEGERAAAMLAIGDRSGSAVTQGFKAIARPIPDERGSIVLVEPIGSLIPFTRDSLIIPLLGMTLLAVAAAFLIARSVVRPLQKLATNVFSAPGERKFDLPEGLTERHDEIGMLARTLIQERSILLEEQDLRRKSEKMALLGQLATSLAHEIKNPASAIIMHGRALEEQGGLAEGRLIREEGEHITSLVNQWLYVARPQAPRNTGFDLSAILETLKQKLQPLLEFHRCTLVLETPDSLPLSGDPQRIEQAFRNLIDNAIKAMPNGGTATLSVWTHEDGGVGFSLADEGGGFSEQALKHFGETFYSERSGGMGLGLALASGVIKAHGGTLSAENQGGALVSGTLKPQINTA